MIHKNACETIVVPFHMKSERTKCQCQEHVKERRRREGDYRKIGNEMNGKTSSEHTKAAF